MGLKLLCFPWILRPFAAAFMQHSGTRTRPKRHLCHKGPIVDFNVVGLEEFRPLFQEPCNDKKREREEPGGSSLSPHLPSLMCFRHVRISGDPPAGPNPRSRAGNLSVRLKAREENRRTSDLGLQEEGHDPGIEDQCLGQGQTDDQGNEHLVRRTRVPGDPIHGRGGRLTKG